MQILPNLRNRNVRSFRSARGQGAEDAGEFDVIVFGDKVILDEGTLCTLKLNRIN